MLVYLCPVSYNVKSPAGCQDFLPKELMCYWLVNYLLLLNVRTREIYLKWGIRSQIDVLHHSLSKCERWNEIRLVEQRVVSTTQWSLAAVGNGDSKQGRCISYLQQIPRQNCNLLFIITEYNATLLKLKIKSVAYSSQGSHTGQLDFSKWLADSSTMG